MTPWRYDHDEQNIYLLDERVLTVGEVTSNDHCRRLDAVAHEVVHRLNAYDALLNALQNIVSDIEPTDPSDPLWFEARAALSAATKE
jgi:hypothetical protein